MRQFLRASFVVALAGALAGCRFDAHSPTVDVIGSYFPAWMICIIIGLVLTLVTRLVLIGLKIDAYLRPILLVYLCMLIGYTLVTWLVFFQN
jgi:hypothetical protein